MSDRIGKEETLSTISVSPTRGETSLVNLDTTIGTEIRKTGPAMDVSSDAVGRLSIKLVAPLTDLRPGFAPNVWHVQVDPDSVNVLAKPPAVDRR